MNIKAYAEEHDERDPAREWRLLNEAQAIIPTLSSAQKRAMAHGGRIGDPTRKVLLRKKLWAYVGHTFKRTELGEKVHEVLIGRDAK